MIESAMKIRVILPGVCVRVWILRYEDVKNASSQPGIVHLYGLSPAC